MLAKKMITNDMGQQVREIDWEDLLTYVRAMKQYTGKEDLTGKWLVVQHTWGIGDILYSTPALHALKEKFRGVKIAYICSFPDVLQGNPDVDRIFDAREVDDILDMAELLETKEWYLLSFDTPLKGGFDYKIHLRTKPQLNEYLISLLKRDPKTLERQEKEFVEQASSAVITRYRMIALDTYCAHAYVHPEKPTVHYFPKPEELAWARNFFAGLRAADKRPVILIPHTSTRFKDYPNWKQVIRQCYPNLFWFIIGTHRDADEIWYGANVLDCTGAFTLRQSFALCIEADLVCASDTGLFYPRAALGKPVVATYGPHNFEPFLHYFPSAHGLRIERLKEDHGSVKAGMCSSPCYIDTISCKDNTGFSPCLQELSPDVVVNQIRECLHG